MYTMFLDESGDHSLSKIDPQFPVFALAGCIFAKEYHDGEVTLRLSEYKKRLFGTELVVMHTAEIARNKGVFAVLKDAAFRSQFYTATNSLVQECDFTVIAAVIKKPELLECYGEFALDPYALSLECLVERFVFFLQERGGHGDIVAESRNPLLDKELDLTFQGLLTKGTRYLRPARVRERISGLTFRFKQDNVPGLQFADLVATPIARAVIGKNAKPDYQVVEGKFRRREGRFAGAGLVVIPK